MTEFDQARPWPGTRWEIAGVTWTVGTLCRSDGETTVLAQTADGLVLHWPEHSFRAQATLVPEQVTR